MLYLHHNKPAGFWIENYSILYNDKVFLVFFELRVKMENGEDIFQEFFAFYFSE
jgi:hypothetical protein